MTLEEVPQVDSQRKSKPFMQVILERRATPHFTDEPVSDEDLNEILGLAAQAPSGFNLQPWRFIVVRDPENRKRLQKVAMNQQKIAEAPVVVIALGMKEEFKRRAEEIFLQGARRGVGRVEQAAASVKRALDFIATLPADVWVNRHTMIAFTVMMLAAEALGYDTAPMEGFDPAGVKREFGIPDEAEVVALLAIGRARLPDKPYGGRLDLNRIIFAESFGRQWEGGPPAAGIES